jgi:hypothetical protein
MGSPCYCVVCAVRLQFKILWQGYIKKEKFTISPTDYNPSVFHRELKNIYGIVPLSPTDSPTDINSSVFHRGLQKIYKIVPQSPMDLPTEKNPSVFHRELQKNYGIVPQSPTDLHTSRSARMSDTCPFAQILTALLMFNTDGFTHILKRTHVWHVSVCTNTDGSKSLAGFLNFFCTYFN